LSNFVYSLLLSSLPGRLAPANERTAFETATMKMCQLILSFILLVCFWGLLICAIQPADEDFDDATQSLSVQVKAFLCLSL